MIRVFADRSAELAHTLLLGESLDPFNPAVEAFLDQARALFLRRAAIQLPRSSWPGRLWRICASSKHPRWLISMSS
jgi:hypothetical protein